MRERNNIRNPWFLVGLVGIILIAVFIIIGLYGKREATGSRLQVAATIFPLYDLVQSIGGDTAEVILLLPEGESPEALPDLYFGTDLNAMQTIFAIGQGFDTAGIPEAQAHKLFIVDKNVDLLLEQGSTGSPYYWLSVKETQKVARNIAEKFSALNPEATAYYQKRLGIVLNQLANLDAQIASLMTQAPKKQMVIYGYDWAYFARDYNLDIVEFEPAQASAPIARIDELGKAVSDYGFSGLFTDIRLSPDPFLPLMGRQPLSLFHLDIFGGVEERTSYNLTMAYNARTIFEGLGGTP